MNGETDNRETTTTLAPRRSWIGAALLVLIAIVVSLLAIYAFYRSRTAVGEPPSTSVKTPVEQEPPEPPGPSEQPQDTPPSTNTPPPDKSGNNSVQKNEPPPSKSSENSIVISNQQPGSQVVVSRVNFSQPGYVVIRRSSQGIPGEVIGRSELISGSRTNLIILLNSLVDNGFILFAVLHTDDGDGVFEYPESDQPLRDTAGDPIMSRFIITNNAPGNPTDVNF